MRRTTILCFLFSLALAILIAGCQNDGNNPVQTAERSAGESQGALSASAGLAAQSEELAAGNGVAPGVVYTMTNGTTENEILIFARGSDGSLTPAGSATTGGRGTGSGLGSQGALILSGGNRFLFAVNGGSNEVSAFRVNADGLALVGTYPTGGMTPISITVNKDLLYVLHAGGSGGIAGFQISASGALSGMAGSMRPLSSGSAGPAQIEFSPDGQQIVVTEKATNSIDLYAVDSDGRAQGPVVHPSYGNTPFGFEFDHRGRLIVSDAFGGAAGVSALSSYNLSRHGVLTSISGPVPTTQTAACWVVVTKNGQFAYTTNTGSGSVSGYRIDHDGNLSLISPDGRTGVTGDGSRPIDMALSENSRYLYALNAGTHSVRGFQVGADGALSVVTEVPGLPNSSVGLAAR